MARTNLAVQTITRAGIEPTYTAAETDGHYITNSGTMFIDVVNGAGAPINVELVITRTVDGVTPAVKTVAVANGHHKLIGPFPAYDYNQTNGTVWINFSSAVTITCAALQIG